MSETNCPAGNPNCWCVRELNQRPESYSTKGPAVVGEAVTTLRDEYPHYYRVIPGEIVDGKAVAIIDVYRVLDAFGPLPATIDHAVKKLLALGQRGAKDAAKDVDEAIKSLRRWQEMRAEEATLGLPAEPHADPKDASTGQPGGKKGHS